MQHSDPPPAQRLEAGLILADLGVLPEDPDAWVEIPADGLDYAFKIGKYPVTNAQYQRFVQAGGYDRERPWWTEEARRELEKWWGEWPTGPLAAGDAGYDRATLPVVAVSWYEAEAYARWLTGELRRRGEIGEDEAVRLPKVDKWQRAAGGPDGWKYPWGDRPDPRLAHCRETEIRRPTPVHMYPAGQSPEGVFDLAGNVWEWTVELHDRERTFRVLVGASWLDSVDEIGAAARVGDLPSAGRHVFGFRVVVVPVSRARF